MWGKRFVAEFGVVDGLVNLLERESQLETVERGSSRCRTRFECLGDPALFTRFQVTSDDCVIAVARRRGLLYSVRRNRVVVKPCSVSISIAQWFDVSSLSNRNVSVKSPFPASLTSKPLCER